MSSTTRLSSLLAAVCAYTLWGLLPIYWKLFGAQSAAEVVAHRVIWSCLVLTPFVGRSGWRTLGQTSAKDLRRTLLSGVLLGLNWGIFVYAVPRGHTLSASLGYFMTPLFMIASGAVFFGERLARGKKTALVFLAASLVPMLISVDLPSVAISLGLALSWVGYACSRKSSALGALLGLWVETVIMVPVALAILLSLYLSASSLPQLSSLPLLISTGPITLVPLLFFGLALQGLTLTSIAFFQYLSPILQLTCAVAIFGESLTATKLATLLLVVCGIVVGTIPFRQRKS